MTHATLVRWTVAGALALAAVASPGQEAPRPEFKVVIWYSQSDPLGTFRHQIYDVRKGEYTDAVGRWLRRVRADYPSYVAVERDVFLSKEKGATELLKVGAVIKRDLLAAAALSGIDLSAGPAAPSPRPTPGPSPARGAVTINPDLGAGGFKPSANNYLFPVPMPYPRPHP